MVGLSSNRAGLRLTAVPADEPQTRSAQGAARRFLVAGIGAAAVLLILFPVHASARGVALGLTDPVLSSADADERNLWLDRATEARAGIVQLGARWSSIAPAQRSAGFDPTDPADARYDWGTLDAAVRDAVAHGFLPILHVLEGPSWAEGAGRPSGFGVPEGNDRSQAPGGTWKPRVGDLEDFALAIARRYSGEFPDPSDPAGGSLPRVRHFQLWQEPNLAAHLNPRYQNGKPYAAIHYRKMLRRFWAGVHSVSAKNRIIAFGTSPYGDLNRDGRRTPPATFWRDVLCFRGVALHKKKCKRPAKFEIAGHNPINIGQPQREARNPNDASTPDLGKLKRIVAKAQRTGRVKPGGKKPIWATEIWWDTRPPDPSGIKPRKQARWLAEALYELWKQGARVVVWRLIRDQAPPPTFTSWSAGLYFADGEPKPGLRAYEFPFVGERFDKQTAAVWGLAPAQGNVAIERRVGNKWRRIASAQASADRVFTKNVRTEKGSKLRARMGSEASLSWNLK